MASNKVSLLTQNVLFICWLPSVKVKVSFASLALGLICKPLLADAFTNSSAFPALNLSTVSLYTTCAS